MTLESATHLSEDGGRTALVRAWLSTTALFLSGVYLPVAGALLIVLTPQPGLELERRSGKLALLPLVVMTAATTAIAGGTQVALAYLAGFALLTWLLATLLRRGSSIEATVGLTTALVGGVGGAAAYLIFPSFQAIRDGARSLLEESWALLIDIYSKSGVPTEVVERLSEGGDRFVEIVFRIAPALLLIVLGSVVLLNLCLVRWRERRQGTAPSFGDLTRWSSSPATVWVLIAAGYASFLPWPVVRAVAWNVLALVLAVYFCQGLSILQFTFRSWRVPTWARVLAYIFVALEWLAAAVVLLLGIFDQWGDFRQLKPRPVEDD